MEKQEKRITYLDTIAGVLIIYMIFMHCCQLTHMTNSLLYKEWLSIIFSCFMGWFFYKSGMFHKEHATVKSIFLHTFKKLWRPYILFWFIGFFLNALCLYWDGDTDWTRYILSPIKQTIWDGGTNAGVLPMWFLVTLLLVRSFSSITLKFFRGYGWIFCGIIGVLLCLVHSQYEYGFLHPYYVMNFFPATFFYGLGYYMKNKQFELDVFIMALFLYLISFIYPSTVDFRVNIMKTGSLPLWYLYAPAAIIVFNFLAHKIKTNVYPFTVIGRDSMYWFLFHWPVLVIVNRLIINYTSFSGWLLLLFVFLSVIIVLTVVRPIISSTHLNKWI